MSLWRRPETTKTALKSCVLSLALLCVYLTGTQAVSSQAKRFDLDSAAKLARLSDPLTQSFKLYHALRDNNAPVQFIAYPVAGHSPGDPVRQQDVNRRWLEWLEKYLAPTATSQVR